MYGTTEGRDGKKGKDRGVEGRRKKGTEGRTEEKSEDEGITKGVKGGEEGMEEGGAVGEALSGRLTWPSVLVLAEDRSLPFPFPLHTGQLS